MFRNCINILKAEPPIFTSVRWRRKPRWFPIAPSKKFRVPPRPEVDPVENVEILRLYNNYRTTMKGLNKLFREEYKASVTAAKASGVGGEIEEAEHLNCLKINDEWNKEIAIIREKRVAKQIQERQERALIGLAKKDEVEAAAKQFAEELILKEKERAGSYITKENLDSAIEYALDNEIDYNFCIDIEGNFTYGRYTKTKPSVPIDKLSNIAE